jgi:hypothetical protein
MFISQNNYLKAILFFTGFVFLFLTVAGQFFHNHSNLDFHSDCLSCKWLVIYVFVSCVFVILSGVISSSEHVFCFVGVLIVKFYKISQYLRGPPA